MKDSLHITTDPETLAALRALSDLDLGALAANAGISMEGFAEGRSMGGLGPIPVNLDLLVARAIQDAPGEWTEAARRVAILGAKVRIVMLRVKPAASIEVKIDTSAARTAIDDLSAHLVEVDVKLNPLGNPADPVSVARALLKRAVPEADLGDRLAIVREAREWAALAR